MTHAVVHRATWKYLIADSGYRIACAALQRRIAQRTHKPTVTHAYRTESSKKNLRCTRLPADAREVGTAQLEAKLRRLSLEDLLKLAGQAPQAKEWTKGTLVYPEVSEADRTAAHELLEAAKESVGEDALEQARRLR